MIEKLKKENFNKIYSIMEESFPVDEYRSFEEQENLLDNSNYCIYVSKDLESDDIKAFISVWEFEEFSFIEHFAVNPNYRNSGLGSSILQKVVENLSCLICLEVEPPSDDISKRRIEFYKRNNFYANDYEYVQPSISKGRNPLKLMIMTSGKVVSKDEYEKIKSSLYKYVYNVR